MNPTQKRGLLVLCAAMWFSALQIAHAQEMPPRKPGLWKQTQYEGGKVSPEQAEIIYQCADEASDKKQRELAQKMTSCTDEPMKRKGNTLIGRSVCKVMGSNVTTEYVITGDMKTQYRVESRSTNEPPLFGQSQTQTVLLAEFQGPCKPGQKPGDMIVFDEEGQQVVNMNDLGDLQNMSAAKELMQSDGMAQLFEQMQKMSPASGEAQLDPQDISKMMEQLQQLQKLQQMHQ